MPVVKTAFSSVPELHLSSGEFNGSLELLLHLLGEGELEITAISLAAVSDQYLAAVRLLPSDVPRLDYLAEFLVVGAQLVLLKSRTLLPREAARIEQDEVIDETSLEERLREYRRFRQAATHLQERQAQGARAFSRTAPPPLPAPPPPPKLERAAPEQLVAALQRLLAARAPKTATQEPEAPPRVTIGERIAEVRTALREQGRVSFDWLAASCETRGELIVTFLAILELFRAFEIELEQDELFGEIWIVSRPASEAQVRR